MQMGAGNETHCQSESVQHLRFSGALSAIQHGIKNVLRVTKPPNALEVKTPGITGPARP